MDDPIRPERLAEIREADGQFPLLPSAASVYGHRRALLAEVDRLTAELAKAKERGDELDEHNGRILADVLRADGAATRLQRRLIRARALLQRFVDHDDEPCNVDHNGYCQAHGLSSAPCKIAEARTFIAELKQIDKLAKRNAADRRAAADPTAETRPA